MASTENIGFLLIFLVVFTATSAFLIALQASEQSEFEENPDSVYVYINGVQYIVIEPDAGRDYTWVNATDNMYGTRNAAQEQTHYYYPNDADTIHISTIRNRTDSQGWFQVSEWFKYRDFIGIQKDRGFTDYKKNLAVPYSEIAAVHNASAESASAWVNATLDRPYIIVVTCASADSFVNDLYVNNSFNLKIYYQVTSTTDLDPSGTGWWNILWNFIDAVGSLLFGYSMPGVPYLGGIISLGVWTGIFYTAYMIIVRGIHGGG